MPAERRKPPGTFIRVHDHIDEHPKIEPLSDAAFRLLITCWAYSSRSRSDGRLTEAAWRKRGTPKVRQELVDVGLVEEHYGYVQMHDYLDWQSSAEEIADLSEKRSEYGRRGGNARARNQASAKQEPEQVPEQAGSNAQPDTDTDTETSLRSAGRASAPTRGTRIPDPFPVSDEMRSWGHAQGWADRWMDAVTERFVDYWRASPGQRGVKTDWPATWRNWLRKEADRGVPAASAAGGSGRPSWEL